MVTLPKTPEREVFLPKDNLHSACSTNNPDTPSKLRRIRNAFLPTMRHARPPSSSQDNLDLPTNGGYRLGSSQELAVISGEGDHRGSDLFRSRSSLTDVTTRKSLSVEDEGRVNASLSRDDPVVVDEPAKHPSITRTLSAESTGDSTSHVSEAHLGGSWGDYFIDLVDTYWQNYGRDLDANSAEAGKNRQLRLIMFEFLEHLDFITDSLLVLRLIGAVFNPEPRRFEIVSAVLLSGILLTSIVAYMTRRHTIVHNIKGDDLWIFCPGSSFFKKVRECGAHNPSVLLMYERLQWTFTLVMRVLQDIPQLMVVLCLLAQDSGILLIMDASTSFLTLFASSFRMGSLYPYKSSLALLISDTPPIDNPVVLEASPTTTKFPWLVSFTMLVFGICHAICARIMRRHRLQHMMYIIFSSCCFGASLLSASYASYLKRQYNEYTQDLIAKPARLTVAQEEHELSARY